MLPYMKVKHRDVILITNASHKVAARVHTHKHRHARA